MLIWANFKEVAMKNNDNRPLYLIIQEEILAKIHNNQYSKDEPFCTEKSIAEEYGVSRITARRAIFEIEKLGFLYRKKGVGSFVQSNETKDFVITSRPKEKKQHKNRIFSLVVPFPIYQGGMLNSVTAATERLAENNCHLTILSCNPDDESERKTLLRLLNQDVDGVAFYPSMMNIHEDILERFILEEKSVVILDKPHDHKNISSIVCDNYKGSYLLTKHLLDYGHENIAYLSRFAPDQRSSIRLRFNGFADCMRQEGKSISSGNVKTNLVLDYQMLKHTVNSLHKSGVSAIVCENDEFAFYVYMCCRSLSIQVPHHLSITGFDNSHWSMTGNASITTVDQNFEQIGNELANIFLTSPYTPKHTIIPADLIPRKSSGPNEQGVR